MTSLNLRLAQNATLATPRLLLRKVHLSDANDLFEYASDQMTVRYVSFPRHQTVVDSQEAIANHFMPNTLQTWGIIWQETGKFIGTISLMGLDEHQAELGYILNRTFWGQGVMPEAASALLKLCFEVLGLTQVHALHHVENPASGRVMQKIGMQRIGTFPDYKREFSNLTGKVESITAEQWIITKDMYFKQHK